MLIGLHLNFPNVPTTSHQFIHLLFFYLNCTHLLFYNFSIMIRFHFSFFYFPRHSIVFIRPLHSQEELLYIPTPIQNGFHLFCSKTHKQKRNEKRERNAKCGTLTLIRSPLLFNCFYKGTARASLQTKENRLASLD